MIGDNFIVSIKEAILAQKKIALKKNKPLLILLGESHRKLLSYFMEIIIILIAKEILSIKNIMLEIDKDDLKNYAKAGSIKLPPNSFYLYHFLKELNLNIKAIDSGTDLANLYWNISPAGVKFRNNEMCKNIQVYSHEKDAIAIVGSDHLFGLMHETKLSKYFHIFPINITPNNLKSVYLNFYTSFICRLFASHCVKNFSPDLQFDSNTQVENFATKILNNHEQVTRKPSIDTKTSALNESNIKHESILRNLLLHFANYRQSCITKRKIFTRSNRSYLNQYKPRIKLYRNYSNGFKQNGKKNSLKMY